MKQSKLNIFSKIAVYLGTGILGLCYTNCQPALQKIDASSTSSSAENQAFADSKIQIHLPQQKNLSGQQKNTSPGENEIPRGTSLIAVISNKCLDKNTSGLAQEIYDQEQKFPNLDQQAYLWKPENNVNLQSLETAANEDPCLIGIANDGTLHSTARPSDPLVSSANQFMAIGGSDTYDFFADPLVGSTSPVVVAIIDSGIDLDHPDLQNQLWKNAQGKTGYNFFGENDNVEDDFGHGTSVAGILAAQSENSTGIAGVMGHHIKLMNLKVQDDEGVGYISDIVRAINFAQANGADVINISMVGNSGSNAALQSALQSAVASKIFVAVAAGNDGLTLSSVTSTSPIPAIYGSSIAGVMTVGSVEAYNNTPSSFTNRGASYVEIAAPGSGNLFFTKMGGGYGTGTGTSFSSPQVAGAAALVISFLKKNNISYTAANVENIIAATAYSSPAAAAAFYNGRVLDLRGLKDYLSNTYLGTQSGGFNDY